MGDRNLLLAFALSFLVLSLWTSYVDPPRPPVQEPAPATSQSAVVPGAAGAPIASPEVAPFGANASGAAPRMATGTPEPVDRSIYEGDEERYRVDRDGYVATFSNVGGAIVEWRLVDYDEGSHYDETPIDLTFGAGASVTTPLLELGLGDLSRAVFRREPSDPGVVRFRVEHEGVSVVKQYTLSDDPYAFRLRIEITNQGSRSLRPAITAQWRVTQRDSPDYRETMLTALQSEGVENYPLSSIGKGGMFSSAEPVVELQRGIDWAGIGLTYFLAVLAPDQPGEATARFIAIEPGKTGLAEVGFPPVEIPPNQTFAREFRGYAGPKEERYLAAFGAETVRSVDLGWSWLAPLTSFFSWLLGALYTIVPNYGVAIILVTVLVRVATMPLTNKQMRSMERMRAMAPKQKEIQEKYADDRQKQSEELMALYKKEGVNPLGGCFPMLLQLPVFIGLFYALRSSIHLRQAPFVGWIDDLSAPETLFTVPGIEVPIRILPIVMGLSMVIQQRMTPMPSADPAQAKMMMTVMPIMMTVLFYQFPSGLVLYWMVSNILAILHQRWIGRRV